MKKAAIIGAGMGRVERCHQLVKHGYEVTIFERGEKQGVWRAVFLIRNGIGRWNISTTHWFKSDKAVLKLIKN
jgi:cation diffusion facilitator CzcD-associated flavoprotein CzcO